MQFFKLKFPTSLIHKLKNKRCGVLSCYVLVINYKTIKIIKIGHSHEYIQPIEEKKNCLNNLYKDIKQKSVEKKSKKNMRKNVKHIF